MGQALKVIKFDSEDNLEKVESSDNYSKFSALLIPLRTAVIITAIIGVISLILEVRIYFQFRYEIYLARLFPTLFSLIILIFLQTNFGRKNHIALTHIYLFTVLSSISFVSYKLSNLFLINLTAASLFVLTFSIFLTWGRKNQIAAVVYFLVLFGISAVSSGLFGFREEYIVLTLLTSFLILLISIVANHVITKRYDQSINEDIDSLHFNPEGGSESISSNFIKNSLLPLFKCNLGGNFSFINNSFRELLDLHDDIDETKLNFFDYVLKNDKIKAHLLKKIESKGKVENYRLIFTHSNGSQKVLLMDCKSIIIQDEVFLEGSLRDITAQYKQDKLLRAELDDLKKIKRQNKNIIPSYSQNDLKKSNVLSRMGHELRTPMNSVLGFLTLIENGLFENEEELKEFSHSAKLSAESLLGVINDVVEISKIQEGSVEIVKTEFNIRDEVDKVISTLKPHLHQSELSIKLNIDNSIPEIIISDPSKYMQVTTNLLRNAIQASEDGEIDLEIKSVRGSKGKFKIITTVKDSGNGISEEDLYNLLNYDLESQDKDSKITAGILHVMISRELTSLMDGNFTGASEIGQGTEFKFEIEVEQKIEIIQDDNTSEGTSLNFKNKAKLLLVEDNPISRKVEQKLLQEAGYSVDCVDNAAEAIELIQAKNYNLVLMDIELKGVNGLEATQKIRLLDESVCDIPIIAVTAHSSMKDREKCLVAGMNDYISKPINITFLKMTIDQWLQQSKTN